MIKLVLIVIVCISSGFCIPGDIYNDRIVGGQSARPGQFPHQVSLQSNGAHFCGGSIVSPRKILTAAHCVYGRSGFDVVAGINNLYQHGQRRRIASAIYHSDFNPSLLTNDVAIIILSSPLFYNKFVQPIVLAAFNPSVGEILTLSGWGFLSYPPLGHPTQLQTIKVANLDLRQCSIALQGYNPITERNICTISPKGRGPCKGDSGGPLVNGNIQYGIVSWAVPCALGFPDVYTSVAAHRGFIDSYN